MGMLVGMLVGAGVGLFDGALDGDVVGMRVSAATELKIPIVSWMESLRSWSNEKQTEEIGRDIARRDSFT